MMLQRQPQTSHIVTATTTNQPWCYKWCYSDNHKPAILLQPPPPTSHEVTITTTNQPTFGFHPPTQTSPDDTATVVDQLPAPPHQPVLQEAQQTHRQYSWPTVKVIYHIPASPTQSMQTENLPLLTVFSSQLISVPSFCYSHCVCV